MNMYTVNDVKIIFWQNQQIFFNNSQRAILSQHVMKKYNMWHHNPKKKPRQET